MVEKPTRGDYLLDVYLVQPESAFLFSGRYKGPLRGVTRCGMGGKRFCDSEEMSSTCIPQNKCIRATKFSLGQITNMGK